ncbi:MAG: sigma factor-like helix-turn-helix DNA-binding protein [Candidatus Gracilibacteria bacterium]|jgi:hypothetical protein
MPTLTEAPINTLKDLKGIVDNLLLLLSAKEKIVIKKRFNLEDAGKHTLEEIGQEFSVTRERIRQIEKNALTKMRRNVFNTSLKFLHEYTVSFVRTHGGLTKEDYFVKALSSIIPNDVDYDLNNLHFAIVLNDDLECIGNTINFYPHIREKNLTDYALKYASSQLIKQLQKYGDVKEVIKLHSDLKNVFDELNFDLTKTKSLITIDKRLTLIDDKIVGLMEWRHIHPRTLRDKILYILRNEKKPLHFAYIAEKIVGQNFDNKRVNIQAVHNELIRHDQFVLIGRGIYALKEWGYEKGTVADVIEQILADKKTLEQDEIVTLVLQRRQVKKITVILALKKSDKFERVGRKAYKLIK